mmetsp:Transcript_5249/g.8666  ORF Transcript_5249/g.8666 Transcript_5249/m.8666 type:complete len:309 (-) Transcript_5249:305-1231(-)
MIYTVEQLEVILSTLVRTPAKSSPSRSSKEKKESIQQPPSTCYICLSDDKEGMITLQSCQHTAHQECIKGQLAAGWTGKRISFGYMSCGECRVPIFHRKLKYVMAPHYKLKREVEMISYLKCLEDNVFEDLESRIRRNEADAKAQCVSTLSCFMCNTCNKPFCAGRVNCADDNELDVTTLNCASCAFEAQAEAKRNSADGWRGKCHTHGYKFAMYKCDSCCSMATFDCRSNHYCARCHNSAYSAKDYPCPGVDKCPLGIEHPPNVSAIHGEDRGEFVPGFVVGCFRCFMQNDNVQPDFDAASQWEERF